MKFILFVAATCLLFIALLASGIAGLVSTLPGAGQTNNSPAASPSAAVAKPYTGGPTKPVGNGDIVSVRGIRVHHSIADNVAALVDAAAADGLRLTGWGYRDAAGQIATRKKNCGTSQYDIYQKPSGSCRPPTARPGTSQHERGLAIDFENCNSRAKACYKWLNQNAARFGLINFPREPWHWSTTGR